jgi:hypothetical protein
MSITYLRMHAIKIILTRVAFELMISMHEPSTPIHELTPTLFLDC